MSIYHHDLSSLELPKIETRQSYTTEIPIEGERLKAKSLRRRLELAFPQLDEATYGAVLRRGEDDLHAIVLIDTMRPYHRVSFAAYSVSGSPEYGFLASRDGDGVLEGESNYPMQGGDLLTVFHAQPDLEADGDALMGMVQTAQIEFFRDFRRRQPTLLQRLVQLSIGH